MAKITGKAPAHARTVQRSQSWQGASAHLAVLDKLWVAQACRSQHVKDGGAASGEDGAAGGACAQRAPHAPAQLWPQSRRHGYPHQPPHRSRSVGGVSLHSRPGRLRSHTWHTAALHEVDSTIVRVFTRERLRHLVCVPPLRKHVGFVTISKLTVAQLTYLAEWSHASEAHWTEHLRATRRHSHIVGINVEALGMSHAVACQQEHGMPWLMLVVGLLTSYILIFVTRPLDGGLMAALPLSPGRDLFAHRRPMLWVVVAGWLGVGQGGGDRCSHLLVTCGRPVEAS